MIMGFGFLKIGFLRFYMKGVGFIVVLVFILLLFFYIEVLCVCVCVYVFVCVFIKKGGIEYYFGNFYFFLWVGI